MVSSCFTLSAPVADSLNSKVGGIRFFLPASPASMVDYIFLPCRNVVHHDGGHEKDYICIPQQLKVESICIRFEI